MSFPTINVGCDNWQEMIMGFSCKNTSRRSIHNIIIPRFYIPIEINRVPLCIIGTALHSITTTNRMYTKITVCFCNRF